MAGLHAQLTEPTELRVLDDEAAIHVGVRLRDRDPARIVRQLSRRGGLYAVSRR